MIHYNACPVCGSDHIQFELTVKDYTVSQNLFPVWHCHSCTARFTQDVPDKNTIGTYYQSDNYISHSNTKKGLVNNLYHRVRKRTLHSKRKTIIKHTNISKGNLLDIGCGTGAFLYTMKQACWSVTGLEPDPTARQTANELYNIQPLESQKLFELTPHSYDAVTLWHVLEHVHELHIYLKKITELLTPKGRIFIAVPNYTSYDAKVYKQYWAAYDVPRHLYHFSPESVKQLITTHNLKIKTIRRMWFDSFYVSMLSEQYKKGRNNIIRAFWNGLISNIITLGNKNKCSSLIYIIEKQ